jgi:hypothetical protein
VRFVLPGCGLAAVPTGSYFTEQPGCVEHAEFESCSHGVGDPAHIVVVDHEHPFSPAHAVCVAFELQAVTVPEHDELHEQPYSLLQVVDVVFELHGVTVPLQGALHEQPDCIEHTVCDVIDEQAESVPVQGTENEQPAFEHRVEDWNVEQSDAVPEHVYVLAFHMHPMLRQLTLL